VPSVGTSAARVESIVVRPVSAELQSVKPISKIQI